MLAAGTFLVMIGAGVTTENTAVPLHALLYINDSEAVAACTFNPIDCHAHAVTPVSMVMSSSCSWGSTRCSVMFVSMSRTWQSGML